MHWPIMPRWVLIKSHERTFIVVSEQNGCEKCWSTALTFRAIAGDLLSTTIWSIINRYVIYHELPFDLLWNYHVIYYELQCDLLWTAMWSSIIYHMIYHELSCDLSWPTKWSIMTYHVIYYDLPCDLLWTTMWSIITFHVIYHELSCIYF